MLEAQEHLAASQKTINPLLLYYALLYCVYMATLYVNKMVFYLKIFHWYFLVTSWLFLGYFNFQLVMRKLMQLQFLFSHIKV
jgi:hypothetical protein